MLGVGLKERKEVVVLLRYSNAQKGGRLFTLSHTELEDTAGGGVEFALLSIFNCAIWELFAGESGICELLSTIRANERTIYLCRRDLHILFVHGLRVIIFGLSFDRVEGMHKDMDSKISTNKWLRFRINQTTKGRIN